LRTQDFTLCLYIVKTNQGP